MTTNAHSSKLAVRLSDVCKNVHGTSRVASLTHRLVGEVRGGVRYGDDVVRRTFVCADYQKCLEDSAAILNGLLADPEFIPTLTAELKGIGMADDETWEPVTEKDVRDAFYGTEKGRKGLVTAVMQSLAQDNQDSTSAHVYEPLMVDGEKVPGAKVYKGTGNPADPRAPKPGTLYLSGYTVHKVVVTRGANGAAPAGRQGLVAKIKQYVCDQWGLPHAMFKSFRLTPGEFTLTLGGLRIVG